MLFLKTTIFATANFDCTECGKHFKTGSNMRVHMRVHTGEKPFNCQYCDKGFTQRDTMVCHERVHTGEKPFQCPHCSLAFMHQSTLRGHIRVHTGDKPYKCSICGRKFVKGTHLSDHMRLHTGEKPYKCGVCNRCFTQKCHLTKHEKTHKWTISSVFKYLKSSSTISSVFKYFVFKYSSVYNNYVVWNIMLLFQCIIWLCNCVSILENFVLLFNLKIEQEKYWKHSFGSSNYTLVKEAAIFSQPYSTHNKNYIFSLQILITLKYNIGVVVSK